MERIIILLISLFCQCFYCAATSQDKTEHIDDTYLVPNPQTARWSYVETDAAGKQITTYYHSVESIVGDAINGKLRMRVEKVPATSPADTARSFIFYCFKDGEYMLDMNAFFEDDVLASLLGSAIDEEDTDISEKEMENALEEMKDHIRISGEIRGMPRHPKVGKLPDYKFQFKFSIMSVTVSGQERRIVGTERIKTEAGSFDCFILEETITTKAMMMKDVEKTRSWYSYGIGLVKEISYDKKGNLLTMMVLDGINW